MLQHEFGSHIAGGDGCRHDAVEKTHLNVVVDDEVVVQFDVTAGKARFRMKQDGDDIEIFESKCGEDVERAKQYVIACVDEVELVA